MPVVLVTGPVRSGKSTFAARLAVESALRVTYVATAAREAGDAEWDARIERHRAERASSWKTIETAALTSGEVRAIFANADSSDVLVVDALGTWVAAQISADVPSFERDARGFAETLESDATALVDAMRDSPALVIVVGEQVGWDVVPAAVSARVFRDVLGRMQQRLGSIAQRAYLVVAGFAIDLRALGERVR